MGRKKAMKRARNKDKKKARAEYKKTGLFFKSLLKEIRNKRNKKRREYIKKVADENKLSLEKLQNEENRKEFCEIYHVAAGVLSNHRDEYLIKKYDLNKNKSKIIVDFYKNYFKNEFGLILLDIGPDGTNMEYGKSNGKPITFVGLTSCLGLVCPGKGGVHLSLNPDKCNIYVERIKFIHELCGNGELIACDPDGNPESHIICFFIQYHSKQTKQEIKININDKEINEFFNMPGSFKNSEKVKKYIEEYIKDENVKWYFEMFLNDKIKNSNKSGSTITYS